MAKTKKVEEKQGCDLCKCKRFCNNVKKGINDICACACMQCDKHQIKQEKHLSCNICENLTCPQYSKRPCKQSEIEIKRRKYILELGKNPDVCFPKGELLTGTQEKLF